MSESNKGPNLSEELKKFAQPGIVKQREKQIKSIAAQPGVAMLAKRALKLLTGDDDETPDPYTRDIIEKKKAWAALKAMPAKKRRDVLGQLFPKLAALMEAALEIKASGPLSGHWHSTPFRRPQDEEAIDEIHAAWFGMLPEVLGPYDQPIEWYAQWMAHLREGYWQQYLGPAVMAPLFAAAIDKGDATGREVLKILIESASGTHPIGRMGHHIPRALLTCSNPEAWEFVEKFLLAAQRDEGLRQSILEVAHEGHPEAFRRILKTIVEHNLSRYSSVVRAVDVWLGYNWDSQNSGLIHGIVGQLLKMLEDGAARKEAIVKGDAESLYLALFAIGFENLGEAVKVCDGVLLKDPSTERRAAALYFRRRTLMKMTDPLYTAILEHPDIRLGCMLNESLAGSRIESGANRKAWLERCKIFLNRLPAKPVKLEPIVWPWLVPQADRHVFYRLMIEAADEPLLEELIGDIPKMGVPSREALAGRIAELKKPGKALMQAMVRLTADASSGVRKQAFEGLKKHGLPAGGAPDIEALFSRKADDLRKNALEVLLKQKDAEVLASADRMLASPNALTRLAALDMLRQMVEAGRSEAECRRRVTEFESTSHETAAEEKAHLEAIAGRQDDAGRTVENGFGLYQPEDRTPPVPPKRQSVFWDFKVAAQCLADLDQLVNRHASDSVVTEEVKAAEGKKLLDYQNYFVSPRPDRAIKEDLKRLPLADVWQEWFANRPATLRDRDGMELLRAKLLRHSPNYPFHDRPNGVQLERKAKPHLEAVHNAWLGERDGYSSKWTMISQLLLWDVKLHATKGSVEYLLDALENALALVPESERRIQWVPQGLKDYEYHYAYCTENWRDHWLLENFFQLAENFVNLRPDLWDSGNRARLWRLYRWRNWPVKNEPKPGEKWWDNLWEVKYPKPPSDLQKQFTPRIRAKELPHWLNYQAVDAGAAHEADVIEQLIAESNIFGMLTDPKGNLKEFRERHPWLKPLVAKMAERFLEIEYERGEAETPVTDLVRHIVRIEGRAHLVRLLHALQRHALKRNAWWGNDRSEVFSALLRKCHPAVDDTPENVGAALMEARIDRDRLLEVAVFAPQWAAVLEKILGIEGLEDGVWWFWAHLREQGWRVSEDFRKKWENRMTESTAITAEDLTDGAVDVAWFHRVREQLGDKNIQLLLKAAKYASEGTGHTRASLCADALLGKLDANSTMERIEKKRHQDSVRALGLIPLPEGEAGRREMLARYEALKEFLRTSRKFGSMRRQSEKRAVETGMDNLARTAGHPDPVRLEWAMEYEAVADLADGPVVVEADGVTLELSIDSLGNPELAVRRGEKELKSIPPAAKKNETIKALTDRKQQLKRQHSRMRQSLEEAMCRGDEFTMEELIGLLRHPLLRPMLMDLLFVSPAGIGGFDAEGRQLIGATGEALKISAGERLRIAHPTDLFASGEWPHWQRDCFVRERIQPFKQIFRELYVLTEAERQDPQASRRYAGHQVQPHQAMALLGQRGWVTDGEGGAVRRTFHQARITAWLEFMEDYYTAAEVEGLTLEAVHFAPQHKQGSIDLPQLPPRIFSEAMRDLDLVVSVAHRGGVDPEASQSTVEMRAALLGETVTVLRHANVTIDGKHALIEGGMARYSVNLGSGVTHVVPGGSLVIVPVHAQHRGRLFLPFADDDPRTAEILSKILLLADDRKIKDPYLLDQIRNLTA